ncbi:MAG: aspartate aminotransferase family protein [Anaerolineales bacterium]
MANVTVDQIYEQDARLIADAIKLRFFPFAAESGEGCRLRDVEGKEYLDFTAGWALANTGYSHPHLKQAVMEQLNRTTFAGLVSGMHEPALHLAEKLIGLLPSDFRMKTWFGLCGSDACETVGRLLPMATGKRRIVSFIGAYHGSTAASMAMSAHIAHTQFIGGGNVIKVPYPNPYRCPFGDHIGDCGERAIRFLEDYIFKTICPPEDVAGIIIEAVQSDGGDIVPPSHFLPMLEDVCRRHNIYLVVDDVKVGMGRTGEMFSFQHSGVSPDVVILGKSLGGGLPLSAIVARQEILDVGLSVAMFTAAGNALSCAAGLATIEAIEQDGMVENARKVGAHLHDRLRELQDNHQLIGDVRGLGMLQGVELVKDRDTKEPASTEAAKVSYRAFELGLLVFYVGMFSNVLEITPPLILTEGEADEGVAILDQALSDVEAGKVSDEAIAHYAGW